MSSRATRSTTISRRRAAAAAPPAAPARSSSPQLNDGVAAAVPGPQIHAGHKSAFLLKQQGGVLTQRLVSRTSATDTTPNTRPCPILAAALHPYQDQLRSSGMGSRPGASSASSAAAPGTPGLGDAKRYGAPGSRLENAEPGPKPLRATGAPPPRGRYRGEGGRDQRPGSVREPGAARPSLLRHLPPTRGRAAASGAVPRWRRNGPTESSPPTSAPRPCPRIPARNSRR
jgi:hypothetical protein